MAANNKIKFLPKATHELPFEDYFQFINTDPFTGSRKEIMTGYVLKTKVDKMKEGYIVYNEEEKTLELFNLPVSSMIVYSYPYLQRKNLTIEKFILHGCEVKSDIKAEKFVCKIFTMPFNQDTAEVVVCEDCDVEMVEEEKKETDNKEEI